MSFNASRLVSGQIGVPVTAGIDTKNVAADRSVRTHRLLHACVGDDLWEDIKRRRISGRGHSHDVLDVFGDDCRAPKPEAPKVTLTSAAPRPLVTDPEIMAAEATFTR